VGLLSFALIAPEAGDAGCGTKLKRFCALALSDGEWKPRERARKWGWGPRLQRSLTEAISPRGRIKRSKREDVSKTQVR
jgi:hypothetical protein